LGKRGCGGVKREKGREGEREKGRSGERERGEGDGWPVGSRFT